MLIHRELFNIVWHEEILNQNTFPLLQESELYSLFSYNCGGEFWYLDIQIQQIYKDKPFRRRYQSSHDTIPHPFRRVGSYLPALSAGLRIRELYSLQRGKTPLP